MTNDERHALLLQLTGVVERNAFLEDENARLKERLEAQIKQSVRLSLELMARKAQRRDEVAPEYVTKVA